MSNTPLTDGLDAVLAQLEASLERSRIRTARHLLRQRELLDELRELND